MVSLSLFFSLLFILGVLTVASVGLLLDELAFLWLAIINFVVLFFAWLITMFFKKYPLNSSKSHQDKSEDVVEENLHKKPASHSTYHQSFVKYTHNVGKKKKKMWPILLVSLLWIILLSIVVANLWSNKNEQDSDSLSGYSESILNAEDETGTMSSWVVIESTWQVLSSWLTETTWLSVNSSFVSSSDTHTGTTPVTQKPEVSYAPSTLKFKSAQSVSLLEAVIYLLQTRDVKLNTSKDLKFNGVSLTNPYYKYWYTATKMWLVGSTSSPTSLISCQTYMVLKGMVEKRDVQYTSANVKTQYWAEAQKRDVLNGCVFGKILKGANLD